MAAEEHADVSTLSSFPLSSVRAVDRTVFIDRISYFLIEGALGARIPLPSLTSVSARAEEERVFGSLVLGAVPIPLVLSYERLIGFVQ